MSKTEMIKWLQNLKKDIGQSQHQDLWHYAEVLDEVIGAIEVNEDCSDYYNGYCARHEDGCFHQCEDIPQPKEGKWIIHKINGIPHTVECSHCHQHYDYEELRHLGRSKGCIDIPHCPNCGAHLKGEEE